MFFIFLVAYYNNTATEDYRTKHSYIDTKCVIGCSSLHRLSGPTTDSGTVSLENEHESNFLPVLFLFFRQLP